MSDYKQLDEFLAELLETDIEITRKWSEEEIREIGEAVNAMVHRIVRSTLTEDVIFKRLHAFSGKENVSDSSPAEASFEEPEQVLFELIPVGSVEEGTKIGKPDEREMLLIMKAFLNLELTVQDSIYEQKDPVHKLIYLNDQDKHGEIVEVLKGTTPALVWKTSNGSCVSSSGGINMHLFKQLQAAYSKAVQTDTVITKPSGQLKIMHTRADIMVELGRLADKKDYLGPRPDVNSTGPAVTLTFAWKSTGPDRHTLVDVDIVPNIVAKRQSV